MASYNIHGGHNPSGKVACGAKGLLDESIEDRLICKSVIKYLRAAGHTAYDCTCNNGTGQTDVLRKICNKCNQHNVALDVSIHLNSGRNDKKGDGKLGGFEIWATNYNGIKKTAAERIVKNMGKLGFSAHGDPYKETSGLYYLNHTKNKALLLEICFVDDKDDSKLYKKVGYDKIGKAIAEGIIGKSISVNTSSATKSNAYKGKVTASALYIRSKAGFSASIKGIYEGGTVISILSTTNGWGKTDKGWVCLKYVKKC